MSIGLKFNNGNPALLYDGRGLALISEFGLHTEYELNRLREALAAMTAERDEALKEVRSMQQSMVDLKQYRFHEAIARVRDELTAESNLVAVLTEQLGAEKTAHYATCQERDAARRRNVEASDELDELRGLLEEARKERDDLDMKYGASIAKGLQEEAATLKAEKERDEARALAAMRGEALRDLPEMYDSDEGREAAEARIDAALSGDAGEWLAARDLRVAEVGAKAATERARVIAERWDMTHAAGEIADPAELPLDLAALVKGLR